MLSRVEWQRFCNCLVGGSDICLEPSPFKYLVVGQVPGRPLSRRRVTDRLILTLQSVRPLQRGGNNCHQLSMKRRHSDREAVAPGQRWDAAFYFSARANTHNIGGGVQALDKYWKVDLHFILLRRALLFAGSGCRQNWFWKISRILLRACGARRGALQTARRRKKVIWHNNKKFHKVKRNCVRAG